MGQMGTFMVGVMLAGVLMIPSKGEPTANATAPMMSGAADPCRTRLPLENGMSGLHYSTLHAKPYTLTLGQFGRAGTRQELRSLHGTSLPGDTIEQIEFSLPGQVYLVSGLVHAFTNTSGLTQHVCADQPLYINHGNSAYDIAHPHTAMVRVEGFVVSTPLNAGYISMKFARFTIWIGGAHYSISGSMVDSAT